MGKSSTMRDLNVPSRLLGAGNAAFMLLFAAAYGFIVVCSWLLLSSLTPWLCSTRDRSGILLRPKETAPDVLEVESCDELMGTAARPLSNTLSGGEAVFTIDGFYK